MVAIWQPQVEARLIANSSRALVLFDAVRNVWCEVSRRDCWERKMRQVGVEKKRFLNLILLGMLLTKSLSVSAAEMVFDEPKGAVVDKAVIGTKV